MIEGRVQTDKKFQPGSNIKSRIAVALLGLMTVLPIGRVNAAEEIQTTGAKPASSPGQSNLETDVAENVALRILKLEAQVKPVTGQMFQTVQAVVDEACATIGQLPRKPNGRWDRGYALRVLRCIDSTLISHGFLYPDTGAVDLLADAFTPFQMSPARRRSFESWPQNSRRSAMIAEKLPGPFHAADCDTASFIYLAVAERLNLPLRLVIIPSFNRRTGHAFVRWREGSHHLDWETGDGREPPEGYYLKTWKIPVAAIGAQAALADLAPSQVLGCAHHLLAVHYEREKAYERALQELSRALELFPQNLDARREFAWVAATAPGVRDRRVAEAITHASFVVRLANDPDAHDTLAAAYASAGMFDLAVKAERAALSHSERAIQFKLDYTRRLRLYEQKIAYRQ